MSVFRSLGLAGWAWRSALPFAPRPSVWLPFLVIAASQLMALGLLLSFHRAWLLPWVLPMVERLGGESASHYPHFFFHLPVVYSRVGLVISMFVGSLAVGVATVIFAKGFGVERPGGAWSRALRRAPALILLTAITAAATYGASMLSSFVPKELVHGNRMVQWGTRGASLLLIVVIETLMTYATAWIMLEGARLLPAMRDSIRVTIRTFLPTAIVVGAPLVLLYPLSYLSGRIDLFALKLTPETVVGVLITKIGLELVVGFLYVGAVTRLFVWRMEVA
jgi:hypothetical protein